MTDSEYRLTPMKKTQSIPIHWEFNQDDYDKLLKGHRSNLCVFLRGDVVHLCTIPGKEFYRFAISETDDGTYVADSLETYTSERFFKKAREHGWTEERIKQSKMKFKEDAIEETTGLLTAYFGISVS